MLDRLLLIKLRFTKYLNIYIMIHFYLENYGCQMNRADSNSLIHSLQSEGFLETTEYIDANIIIINTCSVRQHAEDRVFARVRLFNAFKKRENKSIKIIVMGCMAQTSKDMLYSLGVDKVFDVYNEIKILDYVKNNDLIENDFNSNYIFSKSYVDKLYSHKAFLPITHGCDNWCTYCIVPHTRGGLISRASKDILDNLKSLIDSGAKEITLLGQNVNSYGEDTKDMSFVRLLKNIDKTINGRDIWIRFTTSHPKDFDKDLAHAIINLKSVCEHIHLPFQSGSNRILNLMDRKYTVEEYLEKVSYLRDITKDFLISTDIIVGFADETDEEFNETLNVIKKIGFEEAYLYKYSERVGTVAYKRKIAYDANNGSLRLSKLIEIQRAIALKLLTKQVGSVHKVMINNIAKDKNNYLARSRENRAIVIKLNNDKALKIGEIYNAKITDIRGHSLIADII